MNLVVNAREAMSPGGRLTLETADVELDERFANTHGEVVPGRYVMMAVSDTGCGMDQERQAAGVRAVLHHRDARDRPGPGNRTRHGARQSGGHVFCYSEPGMGTTFKVYLPRTDEELAVETAAVAVTATTRGTETVLLAEDEESLRLSMKKILEKEGYTVLAAANGGEALLLCRRHRGPDRPADLRRRNARHERQGACGPDGRLPARWEGAVHVRLHQQRHRPPRPPRRGHPPSCKRPSTLRLSPPRSGRSLGGP